MKNVPLWVKILLAIAAAILAFATAMTGGCSVAVDLQLRTHAATKDNAPPPLPLWSAEMSLPPGYDLVDPLTP